MVAAKRFESGTADFRAELSDRKIGRPRKRCGGRGSCGTYAKKFLHLKYREGSR